MELALCQSRRMVRGGRGWGRTSWADCFVSSLCSVSPQWQGPCWGRGTGEQAVGSQGLRVEVPAPYFRGQGFSGCYRLEHLTLRGLEAADRTFWEGEPGAWSVRGLACRWKGKKLSFCLAPGCVRALLIY